MLTHRDLNPYLVEDEEEEEETDVPVAEETAPDSSTGDQPAHNQEETASAEGPTPDAEQTVPYSRFKAVNEQARKAAEYEKRVQELEAQLKTNQQPSDPNADKVKEQLKALGFVSQEEIDQRLKQQREDERLEQKLSQLEKDLSGKDGRPKFDRDQVIEYALARGISDVEVAYKVMHEKELTDWHVKQALSKSGSVKSEASDGSGSSQVGTTNEDLREAVKRGDRASLLTLLKRTANLGNS